MKGSLWTKAEDETAKALWAEGKSASQIGAVVNRSRNSVIGRVHRLRLKQHGIVDPPRPLRNGKPRGRGRGGADTSLANKIAAGTFAAKPKPFTPKPIPVHAGPAVNILDDRLGHFHCRHIVSGTGPGTMFCAAPVAPDSAFRFCDVHRAVFTTKASGRSWSREQRAAWFRSRATNAGA